MATTLTWGVARLADRVVRGGHASHYRNRHDHRSERDEFHVCSEESALSSVELSGNLTLFSCLYTTAHGMP
jgi:hypothetical protein